MRHVAYFAVACGLALSTIACGKRGALIYPDLLVPEAPAAVSANQSGTAIRLQFVLPAKDRAGRKLLDLAGVKISKRIDDVASDSPCPACISDYKPLFTLYLDALQVDVQRYGDSLLINDNEVQPGKRYSYRLVPVTRDGTEGAPSSSPTVALVSSIPPPTVVVESLPAEIKLSFSAAPMPADRSVIGFNLYRTTSESQFPYLPLNRRPIIETTYPDSGLERNIVYRYRASTIVRLASGAVVESLTSDKVSGMLKDDEL